MSSLGGTGGFNFPTALGSGNVVPTSSSTKTTQSISSVTTPFGESSGKLPDKPGGGFAFGTSTVLQTSTSSVSTGFSVPVSSAPGMFNFSQQPAQQASTQSTAGFSFGTAPIAATTNVTSSAPAFSFGVTNTISNNSTATKTSGLNFGASSNNTASSLQFGNTCTASTTTTSTATNSLFSFGQGSGNVTKVNTGGSNTFNFSGNTSMVTSNSQQQPSFTFPTTISSTAMFGGNKTTVVPSTQATANAGLFSFNAGNKAPVTSNNVPSGMASGSMFSGSKPGGESNNTFTFGGNNTIGQSGTGAFQFGVGSGSKQVRQSTTAPVINFGQSNTTAKTESTFNFGQTQTTANAFGGAPSLNFGGGTSTTQQGMTFNNSAAGGSTAGLFNFGVGSSAPGNQGTGGFGGSTASQNPASSMFTFSGNTNPSGNQQQQIDQNKGFDFSKSAGGGSGTFNFGGNL